MIKWRCQGYSVVPLPQKNKAEDFGRVAENRDFDGILQAGILDYIKEMKSQRKVHYIGFSSHTPSVAEEKDYSIIGEFTPAAALGNCVYCNHCQPCPAGIDVGLVNKYYDLALAGDVLSTWYRAGE
ncbi:MAG: hypothetical protein NC249_11185 [Lachnoclostridium sp.]|nr:hypothetical protein [Lachnoclostridium sp.]